MSERIEDLYREYLELLKEMNPTCALLKFGYLHPITLSRLKKRIEMGRKKVL